MRQSAFLFRPCRRTVNEMQGRWLDDVYAGMPRAENRFPTPRWNRWMKWTWPAALAAVFVLSAWFPSWGWAAVAGVWIALSYPFYRADHQAYIHWWNSQP